MKTINISLKNVHRLYEAVKFAGIIRCTQQFNDLEVADIERVADI